MTGVDEMAAAAARQPGGTLMLRSDRLTPAELADEVLARADLRQVHGDGKQMRQACGRLGDVIDSDITDDKRPTSAPSACAARPSFVTPRSATRRLRWSGCATPASPT